MKPLQLGSLSTPVRTLQLNLKKLGYGNFFGTGYFGKATESAVRSFQLNNDLPATGIWSDKEAVRMILELSSMNRRKIYETAIKCLHTDASPNDLAPDEYGCADTISSVLQKALGAEMGIDYTISTAQMYQELLSSKAYMAVQDHLPGDIIISPTGFGNGGLSNGHVGIWGEGDKIMSNTSATGTFEQNYDEQHWKARYVALGGFPMRTFRKL